MKNKNYITKYLIIILPLLFINLNAQDQVDPLEKEAAAAEEATAEVGETESTEVTVEEVEIADEAVEVEELAVKESSGYNVGFSGSMGFIQGGFFDNIPIGGSVVISTPWGFDVAGIRFGLSATVGAYPAKHNTGAEFTPLAIGVGGNLTLAQFVFMEGHGGLVGDAPGARGFAGVSLERLMNKGLGLPFNILVGGEGFMSTDLNEDIGSATYWGGLAFRLDMSF